MAHDLGELTTHCIRCGFCLESCPTFKVLGDEADSPRGRIYLVRSALEGRLDWVRDAAPHLDRCLGCRGCETACPSGVEYGAILELARERIRARRRQPLPDLLLAGLTHPGRARLQFALAGVLPGRKMPKFVQRLLGGVRAEAAIPVPQRRAAWPEPTSLPPVRGQVALLMGCVMRVLYPRVHQATERLLRRVGYEVVPIQAPCCGALHAHAGDVDGARTRARQLAASVPSGMPVVVNSAGCGSTMKEYGFLVEALAPFGTRVRDVSEFLFDEGLVVALAESAGVTQTVTYHDACHLAHGQRVTQPPRELLRAIPGVTFVELAEADLCCGSAGTYNILQPGLARQLLDRKWANIAATGAQIVATGNPGCHAWIAQAASEHGRCVQVLHTAELVEASFSPDHLMDNSP